MARYSKAAQERREMDAAREAGSRSRELRSLARMALDRPTTEHLEAISKK
jgi:hypothetical protein